MRTLSAKLRARSGGVVVGLALLGWCAAARAQVVGSDETGAYLVFPKVIVDTNGVFTRGVRIDTLIQLTNAFLSGDPSVSDGVNVRCWYVNANSHCSNAETRICETNEDCPLGGVCRPDWVPRDFSFFITEGQPLAWRASVGDNLPCDQPGDPPCADGSNRGPGGDFVGSSIPPVPQDPFRGELKCVVVNRGDAPQALDRLKGEATIYRVVPEGGDVTPIVDTAAYNAIGFQSVVVGNTATNNGDNTLCIGGPLPACGNQQAEYAGCPGTLILNHFFDGARAQLSENTVTTNLTLVPCSENLEGEEGASLIGNQVSTSVQFLVFNEFEQRFSAATRLECYKDVQLSDIDTRPGPSDDGFSVFWVGVQGTLTGQTRLRGVAGAEPNVGHGLLGVAHEFHRAPDSGAVVASTAFNLHYTGDRAQGDAVVLSAP